LEYHKKALEIFKQTGDIQGENTAIGYINKISDKLNNGGGTISQNKYSIVYFLKSIYKK
jgi:hypothetical protein